MSTVSIVTSMKIFINSKEVCKQYHYLNKASQGPLESYDRLLNARGEVLDSLEGTSLTSNDIILSFFSEKLDVSEEVIIEVMVQCWPGGARGIINEEGTIDPLEYILLLDESTLAVSTSIQVSGNREFITTNHNKTDNNIILSSSVGPSLKVYCKYEPWTPKDYKDFMRPF